MSEIKSPLLRLNEGEAHTADEEGAIVITGKHTHADIIRYVVSDVGEDARYLVERALGETGNG